MGRGKGTFLVIELFVGKFPNVEYFICDGGGGYLCW